MKYLEVVASQTVTLQAQLALVDLRTPELRASVQLILSLGGAWTSAQSPNS